MRHIFLACACITLGLEASSVMANEVVEFEISPGHGRAAWNTETEPVEVAMGDTLRIVNLDETSSHTLHTSGQPCPHGGNRLYDAEGTLIEEGSNFRSIPVGGWLECDIGARPADENRGYFLYNHFSGPSARFYLQLID